MTNMVIDYIYKAVGLIVTGFIAPQVFNFIKAKVGLAVLAKTQKVAGMIWDALNEDDRLAELAGTKLEAFEKAMQVRFPKLTDADILLFNKSLAGVANAGKEVVVKDLEATEAAAPVVIQKYFAADGVTELVPKVADTVAQ